MIWLRINRELLPLPPFLPSFRSREHFYSKELSTAASSGKRKQRKLQNGVRKLWHQEALTGAGVGLYTRAPHTALWCDRIFLMIIITAIIIIISVRKSLILIAESLFIRGNPSWSCFHFRAAQAQFRLHSYLLNFLVEMSLHVASDQIRKVSRTHWTTRNFFHGI